MAFQPDAAAVESQACAHMRVVYRTWQNESGTTSGHWLCDSCSTQFHPRPAMLHALDAAQRETWAAAAQMLEDGAKEPTTGKDEIILAAQEGIKLALTLLAVVFRARAAASREGR